ncbi:hypothetical protein J6590_046938 [Homalodisca vitripennis]|nr:hypothetical protein J6590_046938 [Homalodisca vitripennis]
MDISTLKMTHRCLLKPETLNELEQRGLIGINELCPESFLQVFLVRWEDRSSSSSFSEPVRAAPGHASRSYLHLYSSTLLGCGWRLEFITTLWKCTNLGGKASKLGLQQFKTQYRPGYKHKNH